MRKKAVMKQHPVGFYVRLSEYENSLLQQLAVQHGLCKTDLLRQLIRQAHQARTARPALLAAEADVYEEAARRAVDELAKDKIEGAVEGAAQTRPRRSGGA